MVEAAGFAVTGRVAMTHCHGFRRFLLLVVSLALVWGLGAEAAPRPTFKQAVNEQVAAARRIASELGVAIFDLEMGEEVYTYNPDTPRILASNTKLFTTAAALDELGPGFFFETEVRLRGELRDGTFFGELAIVGGGDPNLSGRHYFGDSFGAFREWARRLRQLGIERLEGDIWLDQGFFDEVLVHPDWPRDQLTRWYEAPVSALSFNDNCVLVKVRPGARAGLPAEVEVVPPLSLFRVESSARTTAKASQQRVHIDRSAGAVLKVTGQIYRRTESIDQWITVPDPVSYFGAALRQALREEGLEVTGQLRPTRTLEGTGWRTVQTHRTDLLTTLEVINKRSQNFYAESLLKVLGAKVCNDGTWAGGLRVVDEFLAELGLDRGGLALADGSGMSRNNRSTPEQVVHLLQHMFEHRWSKEYLASLPYSGERDLRWEKRLAESPYRGNVLAKTGSLSGVSTLSGYAKARSGKVYAFSILCNRIRGLSQARAAQDRILRAVIDHG